MKSESVKISSICTTNAISYSLRDNWQYVNYLDTGNITQNTISEIQYIDLQSEKLPSRAKRIVKHNSIIFSTVRPNQLHYGIIKTQPDNFLVSTGFIVIDTDPAKANADFVYFYLVQPEIIQHLQAIAEQSTSAYPSIRASDIENLIIHLPDLETQNKIGAVLSAIDDKIQLNNAINENLEQLVAAYYKELFGNCDYTANISDYADKVFSGGTPTTSNESYWNGEYNWLSSGETCQKFIVDTEKTITQEGIDNSSTRLASKYDTVIASAGQGHTRGQTSMLLTASYVNQSIITIHSEKVYAPFIYWSLCGRYEELRVISNSNSIRGSLTTKMISSFSVPKVDLSEISPFSDFAWAIIHEIEKNCNENIRLVALRDTLLPKLMNGEIDVSEVKI